MPEPVYKACGRLDYELEMGFFFGGPENSLGQPIDIATAKDRLFGLVLLNDWSARDIQFWEYVPLGPFNGKNFLTTISPWIVTLDALEPFKVQLPAQDPTPLPYLQDPDLSSYDINLHIDIKTSTMAEPQRLATSNLKYLYWSMAQQLAHHTMSGCPMQSGDLMGTGTISGTTKDAAGCLLEMSTNGKEPITLPNGEQRTFLEDGDAILLRGECQGEGYTIGFGECDGIVMPASN
jgi:fumarylacetoacetase